MSDELETNVVLAPKIGVCGVTVGTQVLVQAQGAQIPPVGTKVRVNTLRGYLYQGQVGSLFVNDNTRPVFVGRTHGEFKEMVLFFEDIEWWMEI